MASKIGSVCAVKNLYKHEYIAEDDSNWSEFKDPVDEGERARRLGQNHAIIHRYSQVNGPRGEPTWQTHSVEIKSPRLQAVLDEILEGYVGWSTDAHPYTFRSPFKPILHRWVRIQAAERAHKEKDEESLLAKELAMLVAEFAPLVEARLSAMKHAQSTGLVSFNTLWHSYPPGELMLYNHEDDFQAGRLVRMEMACRSGKPPAWELDLELLDWNGSHFGYRKIRPKIEQFGGELSITRLKVYPLDMSPKKDELYAKLVKRGRKFEALAGYHVMNCSGKKYTSGPPKPVSGRVVIDTFAYYRCQNICMPKLKRLERAGKQQETKETHSGSVNHDLDTGENDAASSISWDTGSTEPSSDDEDKDKKHNGPANVDRNEDKQPLTETECVLACRDMEGFDLKAKEWCIFRMDDLHDTVWVNTPYDNLVLPEGEKDLIFAFASHPNIHQKKFDDFVAQKGQGIIILLCGPPGVGKTLTAEAVAERSEVPLYILTAGDLGTQPTQVEKVLDGALECCRLWDAVLLLDEADVFLQSRQMDSLARNELTSIFLRRLEYYRGLMFLTTNRISSIDSAFKSRLDLILPYYDLTEAARRSVWVNFIEKLGEGAWNITDADFDRLAKVELNGREIKNSIKTSLVLAAGKPLTMDHVKVVLNIRERVQSLEQI